jgi:asparagine synthase (glutamine-hydrolysing)
MCGISGIVGFNWNINQLNKMQLTQHHRGPDAQDTFVDKNKICGLAHNRLSIIDLSDSGKQPMFNRKGNLVIVFNGEIYNYLELKSELKSFYTFESNTDTEVILAAYERWGADCLQRFIGMFAFAIWNIDEQKLFAARDRFGVKPFHYSIQDSTFFFASEIKTLWAADVFQKKVNEKSWINYWIKGLYDHNEETFWEDVYKLKAGHYLTYSTAEGLQLEQWYHLENCLNDNDSRAEKVIAEELLALLEDSVRLRFRADVPVGICLSGGLDSSLLLALVQRVKGKDFPIHAFTFYTGDERYDELPWVNEMLKGTSIIHHKCLLEVNAVPYLSSQISYSMDEPFGGIPTLGMSKVFAAAKEKGIKVLLDGNGMDEGWAGYEYYRKASQVTLDKGPVQGSANAGSLEDCLLEKFHGNGQPLLFNIQSDDKVKQLQYRDLLYSKIPRSMRFADRNSMTYSLELREPFLDHRIIELGLRQPINNKIRNEISKYLPREVAKMIVPKKIREAPKRALQTPQREWLAKELTKWVDEVLEESAPQLSHWFDMEKVKISWENYKKEKPDNSFYIWQLINTALLLK